MPFDLLVWRFSWACCSAAVAALASLGVLGWPHLTGMFVGALMLSGDD